MGNCLRHEKASWNGEEDGGAVKDTAEKESFLGAKRPCPSSREVKITISKKELEQLMKKVDVQGLTLEQVLLAKMVKGDGGEAYPCKTEHLRPWKPVLQSIPEVN